MRARIFAEENKKWWTLAAVAFGLFMIMLDNTIVNVALPSIQDDLHFSTSSLAWVVNAYLITFGGLLLLSGRLGDLIGRRRVFLSGLALFTFASLLCGLASSQALLIAARFQPGMDLAVELGAQDQMEQKVEGLRFHGNDRGALAQFAPIRIERHRIGERMPHEAHRDARFLVERLFEREEHQHAVDRIRDRVDAVGAPGPDRRAHVVHRGDARSPARNQHLARGLG